MGNRKTKIKASASNHGEKQAFLSSVDSWDRKNGDFKNYINELQQILDEKHVNWAMRIGKVIGSSKPTGQLADF